MVEQLTVNQLVVGSSPTRGAKKNTELTLYFFIVLFMLSNNYPRFLIIKASAKKQLSIYLFLL